VSKVSSRGNKIFHAIFGLLFASEGHTGMTLTTNVANFMGYGSRSGLGCSCTGLFCFDDFDALRRRCFGGPTLVTGR